MQYILVVLLFPIAAILVVYSAYALKSRSLSQISNQFAVFMIALALYTAGYAGELLSATLEYMLFWNTVQYIGISFIPFLWIDLAARYVNARFFRRKLVRIVLFSFSCLTFFGACTDPWLHLRYATVFVSMEPGFPVLGFTWGPVYIFHAAYILISLMTGILLLVHSLFSAGRTFLKTLILMIVGASLPCIDFGLYLMNIRFPGIDTIPFSMFFSVLCSGPAIFTEKLLDVAPVARSFVFEMISEPVIVVDYRGRIADYNKAARMLFPDIARGSNPVLPLLGMADIARNGEFQTDIPCGAEIRRYSCHVSRIPSAPDQLLTGRILLFKDITESSRLLEKMEELATVDPLTRLYNRRYFMDRARRIVLELERTGGQLACIIADLDLFKQINDTRGHQAGDSAIQATAAAFTACISAPNIAARFGGEEFICLLPDADAASAFAVAEEIRGLIARIPFPPDDHIQKTSRQPGTDSAAYITASFGVAATATISGEQTITVLISRADKALYYSKNTGRNRTTAG